VTESPSHPERFAQVPARILVDSNLSRDARWLFSLLATHADKNGKLHRSLASIAAVEGVSVRTVERWKAELEAAGYLVTIPRRGRASEYVLVRDMDSMDEAKQVNAKINGARRQRCSEAGKIGAARRAESRGHAGGNNAAAPPTDLSRAPDNPVASTPDNPVAPPATILSPITVPSKQNQEEHNHHQHIPLASARSAPDLIDLTDPPFGAPAPVLPLNKPKPPPSPSAPPIAEQARRRTSR